MGRPFRIFRSRLLNASPEAVFTVVNDFSRWNEWSPFSRADPESALFPSGPRAGVGAVLEWKGKQSGAGRMELTEAIPNERVEVQVDFLAPMKATNHITWELHPAEGGKTEFSWTMTGERSLFVELMVRLLRFERRLERQFDEGMELLDGMLAPDPEKKG